MDDRQNRVVIPSTLALSVLIVTLWASAGLNQSPLVWFPFITASMDTGRLVLDLLIAVGVTSIGIGAVCHSVAVGLFGMRPEIRLVNILCLAKAFGFVDPKIKDHTNKERDKLIAMLLSEFHLRLHSHAPDTLIAHCSRRNSAWYIGLNSMVAVALGFLFALAVMLVNHFRFFKIFSEPCVPQLVLQRFFTL